MAQVKKRTKGEIKSAISGWIFCTPLLALFAVMAVDTSLSLQSRSADYEFGRLDAKRRQTNVDLDKARAEEALWNSIGRVAEIIARLNMLLPDPQQIQVVVAHPETPMPAMQERPRDSELETAGAPSATAAPTAVPAVSTAPAVALPVLASAVPAAPAGPAAPAAVSTAAVAVASLPAAASAPPAKMLDLPKEQITDLDSPDASTNDLLANL
jgi:cell division protein FtsL